MRTLLIAVSILVAGCTDPTVDPDGLATVTHAVDGDTIDVRIGGRDERIRLIGIDTPETKKPNWPVECFGPEASAFTAALLPVGATIHIERDIVGRDDYGRLLGYIWISDATDDRGLFVNHEIIRQGYATPMTIEPNSFYAAEFAAAAKAAEAEDLGLWAACSP